MSKGIIATTLVAAAAASLSVTTSAEALETHQREEQHRQLQWAGVGWGDDDWSSSGKSGKSGGSSSSSWGSSSSGKSGKSGGSSGWSSSGSSSSWDSSSSGKSGKSGSSSWSSSSSSGKSGKSKSSKAHEVWHGGWGKPGWWGQDSSGKSGKSGSSGWSSSSSSGWSSSGKSGKSGSSGSSGWSSSGKSGKSGSSGSSGWSSSGKSGKSGSSSSGWSSSGKSGKSGSSSSGWSSSGKSGKSGSSSSSSGWSSSGKSGKSSKSAKGSKSKGSKSKSSKGGHWSWSDTSSDGWGSSSSSWSSSGKSGKSGSSSGGGGWYGKNDDDWSGGNYKPSKPDYDDWAGLGGGNPSSYKPEPVSAPVHPTGWKDDGWDSDEYYKADIEGIRQECNALITASERELLPKIGRLAFHDCVGGCDGCVNMDNIDNRGLAEPVEGVYPIVQKYSSKLSRADIWAICAIEAVSMAVPGGHNFPLHYIGRKDCADGDEKGYGGENHEMCSSDMSTHDMLTFFSEQFNMNNPREVVAIMGIHSASTANRDNSGFGNIGREDGWVEDAEEYILSNKYYQSMKDHVWELERVENTYPVPTRYQWYFDPIGAGPIMTTSDMAILFNMEGYIQTDKDGVEGLVMCSTDPEAEFEIEGVDGEDIPLCPMAEATKEYVDMYYDDNDLFIQDFGPAMNKILNYGYKTWDD